MKKNQEIMVTLQYNPYCLKTLRKFRIRFSSKPSMSILERFLHKNQHTQRKLLNFENWTNREPQCLEKSEFLQLIFLRENCHWKILALFDISPLHQFPKFNNFLWVCWFLGKNLSNFVSLDLKLHNCYCHNLQKQFYLDWC